MIRIGISGWTYAGWRGVFYPEGLPHRRELEYASRSLDTIEINGTFYSMQRPESFRKWHDETPEDFVFAVKGSRFITHMKRLGDFEAPLANFFGQGLLRLGEKLGPVLWQLPPGLRYQAERVEPFLDALPRTHAEAARVAEGHDRRLAGRAWTEAEHRGPIRHALEPRHPSFFEPGVVRKLRDRGVALVVSDSGDRWPYAEDVTAGFVYVRLHGAEELYASGYTDAALAGWETRVRAWAGGGEAPDARKVLNAKPPRRKRRDVFVYFDNDAKVRAPFDARTLRERLELPPRRAPA
jgi:uncharacterized protein YecE (DUF72 family)